MLAVDKHLRRRARTRQRAQDARRGGQLAVGEALVGERLLGAGAMGDDLVNASRLERVLELNVARYVCAAAGRRERAGKAEDDDSAALEGLAGLDAAPAGALADGALVQRPTDGQRSS